MTGGPLISVITPIHSKNHKLPRIRQALSSTKHPVELIITLNNPDLVGDIVAQSSNEKIVNAPRRGRGFAFLEGITEASGDIVLLLHSDTIPPLGWDTTIHYAMKNPQVVGGGFSLSYDNSNPYLDLGNWALNQWFRLSGELYGDRALFVRHEVLKRCSSALEVPLFEDMRLIRCMHTHGRVVLLEEKVVSSAGSLRKHGFLSYFGKFPLSRLWYALGGSPFHIYNAYYPPETRNK
jgi:glycosyltransferase involved in cell wall biosynthesis